MFISSIKYRLKINRLFACQSKTKRLYNQKIKSMMQANKSKEDLGSIREEGRFENDFIDEQIRELTTNYLVSIARRIFIEIPDISDETMWTKSRNVGRWKLLTEKGISKLRSEIRKERIENRNLWVPWMAALTGIIGALTGLMAILIK